MTQRKTRVAVVFGGRSTEHGVSCLSAGSVLSHLDPERFEVVPVGITREGAWVLGTSDPAELEIRDRRVPEVAAGTALALPGDPTRRELILVEPGRGGEILSEVDVVFPVLHGAFGEDGTIQGLLEMADVPYAGPGVLSSAVSMDKEYTKKLLAAEGISVGTFEVLRRDESTLDEQRRERIGLPAFVKPARAGSSLGITKITEWAQLDDAIAEARRTDPKVIIETAVVGREVECGVLEFPDGRIEASLPAELRVTGTADWYDYESKYLDDVTEFDIPAKVGDDAIERLRATAVTAFRALECQGLARVDFFVTEEGELIVNEVNTMPGFTAISLYPRMWAQTGIDYPALLTTLIDTAQARGTGLR
ncbi:D-alanine--D-alanine ligase [Saccharopolyspora sp. NFXS83]|uniref:D-alanine--D-alanine ligase family protein n=1 Tax=Saccharopolyspora sp. NFXS83 TaxID=2993560 RepID=UPI00224B8748|nr:D-alanine--D-alanine ligase family protein [Saccharopolyspora sp. NFXS83]MCX2733672.1 D-alanine--D-alanine ligase [Saccharopolyspora sp. NFXS83]